MPITVGMVTRDSAERLGLNFKLVLRRLRREVPFSRFILVDSSRLPTTSEIASEEVGAEVVKEDCNRAVARQRIIEMTDTDWLLFVDDDVLLDGGWFRPVSELMGDSSVGLIWGPMNKRQGSPVKRSDSLTMFWREGSTTDTMLRMEALRGIRIPPFLHWREDTYIRNYVVSRGYRCAVSPVGMVHLKGRGQILADNSRVDVRLKWLCERYVGTYRPSARRSLTSIIAVLLDPASAKWRLGWFRYYSNLYTSHGGQLQSFQNIYKPRNQVGVK